jgi:hypothetical protein
MTVESTAPQIFVAGGGLTDFGIWRDRGSIPLISAQGCPRGLREARPGPEEGQ